MKKYIIVSELSYTSDFGERGMTNTSYYSVKAESEDEACRKVFSKKSVSFRKDVEDEANGSFSGYDELEIKTYEEEKEYRIEVEYDGYPSYFPYRLVVKPIETEEWIG